MVMAATVTADGDQIRVDARRELFPDDGYRQAGSRQFDHGADGRLLMLKANDAPVGSGTGDTLTQVVLVQNWFEELKLLVPTN